jgi:3-hydroxyisobutyrate dehydrogenase-like beta-hydroxyacid dehydrogenase
MVGAKPAVFEQVKPLFELMGKNITLVGGIGDGQTCKVCNQIIVALNIEAVGEALTVLLTESIVEGVEAAVPVPLEVDVTVRV